MNTIPFKVNKNIIQKIGGYSIASSENNYTKFDFQFSDDWNKVGIQVSATMFFDSDKIPDPVLLSMRNDNTGYCYLPSVLKDDHGILKLGLTGAYVDDNNEKVVINTLLTSLTVGPGAYMTKYPANDIYKDMLARIASFDKSKQDRLICKNGITIDKDSNISVDDDYVITTGNIPKYVDPIKKEIEQLEKNKLNGMTIRCTDLSELLNYEPGIYLALLNCAGFYDTTQLEECEVLIDEYGITIYIVQAGLFYFITKEQVSNGKMPKKLNLNINEIEKVLSTKANIVKNYNLIDFDEWFARLENYYDSNISIASVNKNSNYISFKPYKSNTEVELPSTGLINVNQSTKYYTLSFKTDNLNGLGYNITEYDSNMLITNSESTYFNKTAEGKKSYSHYIPIYSEKTQYIKITFIYKGDKTYRNHELKKIMLIEGKDEKTFIDKDVDIINLFEDKVDKDDYEDYKSKIVSTMYSAPEGFSYRIENLEKNKADKTDVDNTVDEINASLAKKANKTDVDNASDKINASLAKKADTTDLDTKENISNKVDTINFPSTIYYPSSKAVWDYVNSKISTPLADIETLKNNKVNVTDFNTFKDTTNKTIANHSTNINTNAKNIETMKADLDKKDKVIKNLTIKNTTEKSTGVVLNDSSDCNIVNLICDEKDDSNQIAFYRKNLFDFNSIRVYGNSSASNVVVNKNSKSISFTTSETSVNSGIYIRHTSYQDYKGYGVDYTKLGGKPVALSFDVQSDINCKIGIEFIKASYKYFDITSEKQRIVVTDTVDINKLNKALCFYTNKTKANITISNIQIEVNNTATDYEDCDYQKVSLADADVNSLHTYYPSTTVIADSDFILTYVADNKNYIDNKFTELANVIVASASSEEVV